MILPPLCKGASLSGELKLLLAEEPPAVLSKGSRMFEPEKDASNSVSHRAQPDCCDRQTLLAAVSRTEN